MPTITKTKISVNTKLAVATAILLAAGGIALAVAPLSSGYSCAETDGGQDFFKLGTTTATNLQTGGNASRTDGCYAKYPSTGKNSVTEYYCQADGRINQISYICPSGSCQNGACVTTTQLNVVKGNLSSQLTPGTRDLAKFTFSAPGASTDVKINSLTLTTFKNQISEVKNWEIYDEYNIKHGDVKISSADSNKIIFSSFDPLLMVAVGQSKTLTIRAFVGTPLVLGSSLVVGLSTADSISASIPVKNVGFPMNFFFAY